MRSLGAINEENWEEAFTTHFHEMTCRIDPECFMTRLYTEQYISIDDMEAITNKQATPVRRQRAAKFLDIIKRKGCGAFIVFLSDLEYEYPDLYTKITSLTAKMPPSGYAPRDRNSVRMRAFPDLFKQLQMQINSNDLANQLRETKLLVDFLVKEKNELEKDCEQLMVENDNIKVLQEDAVNLKTIIARLSSDNADLWKQFDFCRERNRKLITEYNLLNKKEVICCKCNETVALNNYDEDEVGGDEMPESMTCGEMQQRVEIDILKDTLKETKEQIEILGAEVYNLTNLNNTLEEGHTVYKKELEQYKDLVEQYRSEEKEMIKSVEQLEKEKAQATAMMNTALQNQQETSAINTSLRQEKRRLHEKLKEMRRQQKSMQHNLVESMEKEELGVLMKSTSFCNDSSVSTTSSNSLSNKEILIGLKPTLERSDTAKSIPSNKESMYLEDDLHELDIGDSPKIQTKEEEPMMDWKADKAVDKNGSEVTPTPFPKPRKRYPPKDYPLDVFLTNNIEVRPERTPSRQDPVNISQSSPRKHHTKLLPSKEVLDKSTLQNVDKNSQDGDYASLIFNDDPVYSSVKTVKSIVQSINNPLYGSADRQDTNESLAEASCDYHPLTQAPNLPTKK